MSFFDSFKNITNNIGKNLNFLQNNTKEAEKNMQYNNRLFQNFNETPDEEVKFYKTYDSVKKYGIPEDNSETIIRYDSVKKYAIPEETIINVKYGIARPDPTYEQPIMKYGIPSPTIEPPVPMYAVPEPEPTGNIAMYAVPTVKPEPTQTITPTPVQPFQPTNPWRINIQNIILNMFGGANSSFAQRISNSFQNFFSRWR